MEWMWQDIPTALWLLGLSIEDVRKKRVPLWLLGIGMFGAAAVITRDIIMGRANIIACFLAILPGAALLLIAISTGKAGCGDGVVLMLIGLLYGRKVSVISISAGLFLAAFVLLVLLAVKRVKRNTEVPFLPFLTAGWGIAVCERMGLF